MREDRKKREAAEAADEKARKLLLEHLPPEQAERYAREQKFSVTASSGAIYELDCKRRMHNVRRIEGGRAVEEYCIYLTGDCPLPDNHLAQMLMLRHAEKDFLRIANRRQLVG